MNISIIVITMVLSLSLVVSFSNSYAEVGTLIRAFDGSDGGTPFEFPLSVAVDSEDRIIVADATKDLIQIFNSTGSFITSFDIIDGDGKVFPLGLAVDSENRILVVDNTIDLIQIFNSEGVFITSFDGSDGGGQAFENPGGVVVDNNDNIIVTDNTLDLIQIFNSEGVFITSFDGSDGGTPFVAPYGLAVDNNDRIIVSDGGLIPPIIQIFNSTGSFIFSIDGSGGEVFDHPMAVAVDIDNNILVVDGGMDLIQIFNSEGVFITSFDGSDGGGQAFDFPYGVAVDNNNNRIIVVDGGIVEIFGGFIEDEDMPAEEGAGGQGSELLNEDENGGCADCTPPTLGLNSFYKRIVDNGFSYNGNSVQVEKWHTPFPLISAQIGQTNTVIVKVYDENGTQGLRLVQFGLGLPEIGSHLDNAEVIISIWFEYGGNNIEEVKITDKHNLIENSSVKTQTEIVDCGEGSENQCTQLTMKYMYREASIYNVLRVNVMDNNRNLQTSTFNDGVKVLGESMNPADKLNIIPVTLQQYPQKRGLVELTQIDRLEKLWTDPYGYIWQGDQSKMVLLSTIPPKEKDNDPKSVWSGYNDRTHSEFASYKQQQIDRAMQTMSNILSDKR